MSSFAVGRVTFRFELTCAINSCGVHRRFPLPCSSLCVQFVESEVDTTPTKRTPGGGGFGGGQFASGDGGGRAARRASSSNVVVADPDVAGSPSGGGSLSSGSFGVSLDDTFVNESGTEQPQSPTAASPTTPGGVRAGPEESDTDAAFKSPVAVTPDPLGARAFGLPPEMLQSTPVSAIDLNSPLRPSGRLEENPFLSTSPSSSSGSAAALDKGGAMKTGRKIARRQEVNTGESRNVVALLKGAHAQKKLGDDPRTPLFLRRDSFGSPATTLAAGSRASSDNYPGADNFDDGGWQVLNGRKPSSSDLKTQLGNAPPLVLDSDDEFEEDEDEDEDDTRFGRLPKEGGGGKGGDDGEVRAGIRGNPDSEPKQFGSATTAVVSGLSAASSGREDGGEAIAASQHKDTIRRGQ